MIYRELGTSGIKAPAVIFGAWAIGGWYWGPADDDAAVDAIHSAIDSGITMVDTAPMYGCGHSEETVGRALRDRRDKALVATKCGLRWDLEQGAFHFKTTVRGLGDITVYKNLHPESIKLECERSLKRLQTDTIDLYQCHWPDPTANLDDAMAALMDLKAEGKIRAIGVSNFSAEQVRVCLKTAMLATDQPRYSLLDRAAEQKLVPFCMENNVGLIVYSPMEQGLLTGKVTMDRKFSEGDMRTSRPWFQPQNRARVLEALARVQPLAGKYACTLAQLCVNWVISQKGITSAIVGARNVQQARENAGAAGFTMEQADLAFIRETFQALGNPR